MISFRRKSSKSKAQLSNRKRGSFLIEMLVALGLGSLLAGILLSILSESMRHATLTQNEVVANSIMMELNDWTRANSYEYLSGKIGEHTIYPNRTISGQPGSDTGVRQEPAQLDLVTNTWSPTTKTSAFNGEIKYILQPAFQNQLRVTIRISWSDGMVRGTSTNPGRSVERSFIIYQYGTNAYAQ